MVTEHDGTQALDRREAGPVDRYGDARLHRGNQPDRYRGRRVSGDRLPALANRAIVLGRECLAHREHDEPVPVERHHVRPRTRGGGDSQTVQLCANAHGRVHALLDGIEDVAVASPFAVVDEVLRSLPRDIWQAYSVIERAIAYRGWQAYGLGFLNGRYESGYRMWRTDGTPKARDIPHFNDLYHAARWSRRWRRELGAL